MDKLGDNIQKWRVKNKLSQQELAKLLEVNTMTIANYEAGRRTPTLEKLSKIVKVLGCSYENLLGISAYSSQKNEHEMTLSIGLTPKAIKHLNILSQRKNEEDFVRYTLLDTLNMLLETLDIGADESQGYEPLLGLIHEYTYFRFIVSGNVKLAGKSPKEISDRLLKDICRELQHLDEYYDFKPHKARRKRS